MPEQIKIKAIVEYLQSEFPECKIEQSREVGRNAQIFRIRYKDNCYCAEVSEEFLKKRDASEIPALLDRFTLAEHLRFLGVTPVVVTSEGLSLE